MRTMEKMRKDAQWLIDMHKDMCRKGIKPLSSKEVDKQLSK